MFLDFFESACWKRIRQQSKHGGRPLSLTRLKFFAISNGWIFSPAWCHELGNLEAEHLTKWIVSVFLPKDNWKNHQFTARWNLRLLRLLRFRVHLSQQIKLSIFNDGFHPHLGLGTHIKEKTQTTNRRPAKGKCLIFWICKRTKH